MDNNGDGNRVHYPKDLQYASYSNYDEQKAGKQNAHS